MILSWSDLVGGLSDFYKPTQSHIVTPPSNTHRSRGLEASVLSSAHSRIQRLVGETVTCPQDGLG